jgi:hypothetical protein
MYRRGLSANRIAAICDVPAPKVRRALGSAKRSDQGLETEHLSNVPEQTALSRQWTQRCEELTDFIAENGRLPFAKGHEGIESRLARWLAQQRSAASLNNLPVEKRRALAALGDWESTPRAQNDARRWEERLEGLAAFVAKEGRFPSYRRPSSERERLLGTWLHGQRQRAFHHRIRADRLQSLQHRVPGWNTWKSVRSSPE